MPIVMARLPCCPVRVSEVTESLRVLLAAAAVQQALNIQPLQPGGTVPGADTLGSFTKLDQANKASGCAYPNDGPNRAPVCTAHNCAQCRTKCMSCGLQQQCQNHPRQPWSSASLHAGLDLQGSRGLAAHQPGIAAVHSGQHQPHMEGSQAVAAVSTRIRGQRLSHAHMLPDTQHSPAAVT